MADRIGVIDRGKLILVENKNELMRKLGRKHLTLQLQAALECLPPELVGLPLVLSADGRELSYTYDQTWERSGIAALLEKMNRAGIRYKDLHTSQSSLEEIFVGLVGRPL